MTRRKCVTCRGAKVLRRVPSAQTIHRKLLPAGLEAEGSVCLCPDCNGSGFQVREFWSGANGEWKPAPLEHIVL